MTKCVRSTLFRNKGLCFCRHLRQAVIVLQILWKIKVPLCFQCTQPTQYCLKWGHVGLLCWCNVLSLNHDLYRETLWGYNTCITCVLSHAITADGLQSVTSFGRGSPLDMASHCWGLDTHILPLGLALSEFQLEDTLVKPCGDEGNMSVTSTLNHGWTGRKYWDVATEVQQLRSQRTKNGTYGQRRKGQLSPTRFKCAQMFGSLFVINNGNFLLKWNNK